MPEILPHPKRGTMDIGTERIMPVFGKIRAADGASDENPVVTIVGTDASEDRHGSVINPRGWQTASYLRNPVALWSHGVVEEYPALGQTIALRAVGGAWEFDIRFALGPWKNMRDNLAQFLWEWYRDFGGPLAASVAFLPKDWADRQATEMPTFFAENVEYREQELTEISFVNVPSNRNAISKAIERARSAGMFTDGMAKMLGFSVSPIIIPARAAAPVEPDLPPVIIVRGALSLHEMENLKAGVTAALTAHRKGEALILPENVSVYEDLRSAMGAAPTVATRMPLASLRSVITNGREALRCGGCYPEPTPYTSPYCELCGQLLTSHDCDEELTGDAATAERETIASMIDALAQELTIALAGWDAAEHDALRSWCMYRVTDCMYGIDRLLRLLDYWYPDEQPVDTATVAADEVRKFIADVEADAELKQRLAERAIMQATRVGAELSAKNQARLRAIHGNAGAIVLACADMLGMNAGDEEEVPADEPADRNFIRIKSGSPSGRDEGAGQLIRVSASDTPDAGAGDRSTPPPSNLYDSTVLKIKRA